jgi:hypothetical protein
MSRIIVILILLSFSGIAQTRAALSKKPPKKPVADTVFHNPSDTIDWNDWDIRMERRFAVYTKRQGGKDKRLRLCVNLIGDTVLNYCMIDSFCKDPEKYRIMFKAREADTTYILLFIDAFSKSPEKPACDAGKETKLMFFRWNTSTNNALIKQRNVSSCMRGITNMTKTPIDEWDGKSVLTVNYYRGGSNFIEMRFDPANYKLGMQSVSD